MKVIVEKSLAIGDIYAPPSKSMAHRALICGAMSEGSCITNIAYSKDILATLGCLESMGAFVEKKGDRVKIGGLDPRKVFDNTRLFCNESGSTLRFFIPLCLLADKNIILEGSSRLFERPLSVYEDICKKQGIVFEKDTSSVKVCGKLSSGEYVVPGDISSQFITGLLFTLPLLEGDSILTVSGKFESASYIDLTLSALSDFGIDIQRKDNSFLIKGGQKYVGREYSVEGDCSNAAFLEGFNLIGGKVNVLGLNPNTLQGDRVYKDIYNGLLSGEKNFDLSDCPDLAPVVFSLAAYCGGAEFHGTARLKLKESDRGTVMAEELSKFGIKVDVGENSVIVNSGQLRKPTEDINGHNDHRIVMAMSLLCSVTGGTINGAEAITKSYPDYFKDIQKIGIRINEQG